MANPNNLPVQLTSFIGREREIAEVKRLLASTRLLTLTGAGGCGKTRLALQVAEDLVTEYGDGVWFVDLAPLANPTLVSQTVASVFNLQETSEIPHIEVLQNYLRTKQLMLVMDNSEHLIEACAQLSDILLRACPHLKTLATSREPLNISGETIFRVPSLSLPDAQNLPPATALREFESIQLFIARAAAADPHFQLTDTNAPAIAQICQRLDGMPLAIELAAARVRSLSVEQIAAHLNDRFQLLTGGSRVALPRHQTLRAAIDWSFDLLSNAERALVRRVSVFAGGWTLEAAEDVCGDDAEMRGHGDAQKGSASPQHYVTASDILDLLTALVDKSLVIVEARGDATRYDLLETVRQYAREKLLEAAESEAYSRQHRDWFLRFAEQAAPKVRGREQLEWLERLDREIENLRAALAWSLAQTDESSSEASLRMAGALWWFWLLRGYWVEARTWLERSLEKSTATPARAMALVGLAQMEYYAGTPTKGGALYDEAVALYRQQGDKWGIAFAAGFYSNWHIDLSKASALVEEARSIAQELKDDWLAARTDIVQGLYCASRGDREIARSHFESALDHARRSGDRWFIGNALVGLGELARDMGDYNWAAELLTESLELRRELGNQNSVAGQLYGLGKIEWLRQDHPQALALFGQAITLSRELGNTRMVILGLWSIGRVAATEGRNERAARLFGAVGARRDLLHERDRREYDEDVKALCDHLDAAVYAAVLAEGRVLTLEQAMEYALREEPAATSLPVPAMPTCIAGLTEREVEVLRWLARGLTNQEIADRLVLSRRTVHAHLRSIFGKLDVTTRNAATRVAIENKIV